MVIGWVPNYRENAQSHRTAQKRMQELMPTLRYEDKHMTSQMLADKLNLNIQTIERAYAKINGTESWSRPSVPPIRSWGMSRKNRRPVL